MTLPVIARPTVDHVTMVKIAREIAIDHFEVETILKRYSINNETWSKVSTSPEFTRILESETAAWQSATNTHERTKLKAAAMVEEYLPEGNKRIHDPKEPLPAKTELLKVLTRIAGMGLTNSEVNGATAEKFSITINLGADKQLKFEKDVTPPITIDGKAEGDSG